MDGGRLLLEFVAQSTEEVNVSTQQSISCLSENLSTQLELLDMIGIGAPNYFLPSSIIYHIASHLFWVRCLSNGH